VPKPCAKRPKAYAKTRNPMPKTHAKTQNQFWPACSASVQCSARQLRMCLSTVPRAHPASPTRLPHSLATCFASFIGSISFMWCFPAAKSRSRHWRISFRALGRPPFAFVIGPTLSFSPTCPLSYAADATDGPSSAACPLGPADAADGSGQIWKKLCLGISSVRHRFVPGSNTLPRRIDALCQNSRSVGG
jgi:hypothetical protein